MIKLYSAAWCGNCPAAKATLDRLGVEYEVIDVDLHVDEAVKAGIRGIPTIITEDGERFTSATLTKLTEYIIDKGLTGKEISGIILPTVT